MGLISEQWTRPRRAREHFPPYDLGDRDLVASAEERTRKLARIYHVAHEQAWDGRQVLRDLCSKHGGIRVPDDKKTALGRIASVLLWGELAAWSISADLALKLEHTDAKMAASSQVFDEARHFYVLRDYLWQSGIPIPRLGGYSRKLLVDLLETDNLLHKLVGMQLLVENAAVVLFKTIAGVGVEPVLSELLYYFERDEARHVGLGVMMLPTILADLDEKQARRLWRFQLKVQILMMAGGITLRNDFAALGIDQASMQRYSFRLQSDIYRQMRERQNAGGAGRAATRGLFKVSKDGQGRLNTFLFPEGGMDAASPMHRRALEALVRVTEAGDRWLAARA